MAGSSAGSDIFFVFAILAVFFLVLLLLRHYLPLRTTPAYLLVPVFLALALPASIILLVPIDLASSAISEDGTARGIWLPERARLVLWRIAYWLTFTLTWIILPLLGEYVDSGYRDPKARMLYSFRSNARYQAIVLACGIVGVVYFSWERGFHLQTLKGLVMALAYAWGLILAIYLMGHGLVAVPRRLYRNANTARRLKNLQTNAPRVHDRLALAIEELDHLEAQVVELKQRKTGTARDFQEWIQELGDTSELLEGRGNFPRPPPSEHVAVPAVITERYLADLTRKLKRARHKRIRFIREWDRLVQEAKDCQAILDAAPSQRLTFSTTSSSNSWTSKLKFMTPYTRYHLHATLLPLLQYALSGLLSLASFFIVWSEIFKKAVPKLSIVGMSILHHSSLETGRIGFPGQLMAAAWLLYMCTAALISISEVKVWGNRALVPRHTYAESACWYACQVAKLTVPLAFNFVTFVPDEIASNTAFYKFLGYLIDLTPISTGFSDWFPIFILVSVLATAFNLYGRVKSIAGFGVLDDDEEENPVGFGTGGWREGRTLIDQEIRSGGSDGLGLNTRDESSPLATNPRTNLLSDSPAGSRTSTPPIPTSAPFAARTGAAPPPARRARDSLPTDEEGTGNFFQDFAHRVKNTVDLAERPQWMKNIKVDRPKWMAGVDGNTESSGRADFGKGLGRWFGGRPGDGSVRL